MGDELAHRCEEVQRKKTDETEKKGQAQRGEESPPGGLGSAVNGSLAPKEAGAKRWGVTALEAREKVSVEIRVLGKRDCRPEWRRPTLEAGELEME